MQSWEALWKNQTKPIQKRKLATWSIIFNGKHKAECTAPENQSTIQTN